MRGMFNEYTAVLGAIGAGRQTGRNETIVRQMAKLGIPVVNIGPTENPDVFIDAALATGAQAILVSCREGRGQAFCATFRKRCEQRGLTGISLYVGGQITHASQDFSVSEQELLGAGFDRVFRPNVDLGQVVDLLKQDVNAKRRPTMSAMPRSSWLFTDFAN